MVTGAAGMVGSAIVRRLQRAGYGEVRPITRREADLTRQSETLDILEREQPEYLFVASARVGGIHANSTYPAQFLYENLMIENNIIHGAYVCGVSKLLFLGSSCIYPRLASQPITEDALLSDRLEPTNEAYAIAKIAGIKLCDSYHQQYGCRFVSAMPTNIYGPGDNFDLQNSHVIPALLRRFHEARVKAQSTVTCWGTGNARREFLLVDDLADALVFLMTNFEGPGFLNVGTGEDLPIRDLAELTARTVGFEGRIEWDDAKPDGVPRKLLNVERLHALGWRHQTSLTDGLETTYQWYLAHQNTVRK